jgi:protein SCO1/2
MTSEAATSRPADRTAERSGWTREQLYAVAALGTIVLVTIGWWMLALWPVPASGSEWLLRTRAVCFGSTDSGLPDAEGWALLIGQPISMTAVLLIGWGRASRAALRRMVTSRPGQIAMAAVASLLLLGAGGATVRIADAAASQAPVLEEPAAAPDELRRLDRAPYGDLALTDQTGSRFDPGQYRGRAVLVTFAFAHCETICPVLVREVLAAQERAGATGARPAVVVLSVDPWRDTPARLPHIADDWKLPPDAHVLSGPVDQVLEELRAWQVHIERDMTTGEVLHPALTYVLDPEGRVAFATTSGQDHLVGLIARARQ